MSKTINRIALALSAGAFLLAAPLAQAYGDTAYNPKKLDKFDENQDGATLGGTLYVVDPTQSVTITLLDDDSALHLKHDFYVYDYNTSSWVDAGVKDNGIATLNGQTVTITPTTNQVAFAIGITDLVGQRGYYIFGTGDGSLDTVTNPKKPEYANLYLGDSHSVVYYDYLGPSNYTKEGNVALIGFEDTVTFWPGGGDWDDVILLASNVKATPAPEPEAYAMLLAGLGLVGAVARRRRMAEKA
ncbi:MAG: PEP-CTERM sorting domain-containing protein [Azoarcus sp.]|jgi:hypothetical protein|nr:PEP-CTERM sorting domain-containing protein [Azoarcus sp.]